MVGTQCHSELTQFWHLPATTAGPSRVQELLWSVPRPNTQAQHMHFLLSSVFSPSVQTKSILPVFFQP